MEQTMTEEQPAAESTEDSRQFKTSDISGFLDRYYLEGEIEKVRIRCEDYPVDGDIRRTLATSFRSTDESIMGTVRLMDFDFEKEFEVAVHDTTRLKKLVGVLEDTVDMEIEWVHRPVSFFFIDDHKRVRFILGNMKAVEKVDVTQQMEIDWNIQFDLNEKFISGFKSGIKALSNKGFAIEKEDNSIKVVLGYRSRGSNNSIDLYPETNRFDFSPEPNKPLSFNGQRCTKILNANSDSNQAVCQINSELQLMKLTFENETFESQYYISAVNPGNL